MSRSLQNDHHPNKFTFQWGVGIAIIVVGIGIAVWMNKPNPEAVGQVAKTSADAVGDNISKVATNLVNGFRTLTDFSAALEPRITINGTTVFEEKKDIAELALLSQPTRKYYAFEHTYLGSTKRLEMEAEYEGKFGYDLKKSTFSINLLHTNANDTIVVCDLPRPKLLTVEVKHFKFLRDEDGFWNGIKPEERAAHMAIMEQEVRLSLIKGGYANDVGKRTKENFEEIIRKSFQFTNAPAMTNAIEFRVSK